MVKYETKMDATGKVYVPKAIRECGITNVLQIAPNSSACVIFRKGTPLKDVLESINIIAMDLEHQLKTRGINE
jgi:bifunctional DNA-binding transcriptional regulator/antitoxin component of YhaV-PrlF toxin-antitoxin module